MTTGAGRDGRHSVGSSIGKAWSNMVSKTPGARARTALDDCSERLDRQAQRLEDQRQRLDHQAERMEKQRDRSDRQQRQIEKLTGQVDRLKDRLDRLTDRLAATEAKLAPLEQASSLRDVDHYRLSGQVGAIEERLADLRRDLDEGRAGAAGETAADAAGRAEAQRLVDAVRREHDQVRVRLQVVSAYEERLRRVEAALLALYDADPRDPV